MLKLNEQTVSAGTRRIKGSEVAKLLWKYLSSE